ncbi:hypothetical protein GCM10027082_36520 [Comamonas humi]
MTHSATLRRRRWLALAGTLAAGAALPALAASKLEDMALALIEKYRLGHSLPQVVLQLAAKTTDYQSLVDRMGAQKAQQQLAAQIAAITPAYQKQWNGHLAYAYAQVFTQPKLESLLAQGPQSPYAGEMQSRQGDINKIMQQRSSAMLHEMLGKVLAAAAAGGSAPAKAKK